MAKKDLQHLVIALSKFTVLRNRFKKDPMGVMAEAGLSETGIVVDPRTMKVSKTWSGAGVMAEAGLSEREKDILASGDADRLRTYLGEEYSKGAIIRESLIRTALIRDPLIRDPKK